MTTAPTRDRCLTHAALRRHAADRTGRGAAETMQEMIAVAVKAASVGVSTHILVSVRGVLVQGLVVSPSKFAQAVSKIQRERLDDARPPAKRTPEQSEMLELLEAQLQDATTMEPGDGYLCLTRATVGDRKVKWWCVSIDAIDGVVFPKWW
jgi:hypothetical protein